MSYPEIPYEQKRSLSCKDLHFEAPSYGEEKGERKDGALSSRLPELPWFRYNYKSSNFCLQTRRKNTYFHKMEFGRSLPHIWWWHSLTSTPISWALLLDTCTGTNVRKSTEAIDVNLTVINRLNAPAWALLSHLTTERVQLSARPFIGCWQRLTSGIETYQRTRDGTIERYWADKD